MIAKVLACLLALSVAATVRADGPDPEPPADPLARLRGTWKARAILVSGTEKASAVTYVFEKDKVTLTPERGKAAPIEMTLSFPDKKREDFFAMKRGTRDAVRYFFKIEKGELYLVPVRRDDADPKPDFSGTAAPVLILKREKK